MTGLLVLAGVMTLLNLRSTNTEVMQQGALISQPLIAPGSPQVSTGDPDSSLVSLPESAAMAASPLAGMLTLEFKFSGDSWVEVRDASNHQVINELGVAGSARQIQAVAPLRVELGAAQAVSVQVNSKAVTMPEKNIIDGVAHFVVKADGLLE